MMRMSLLALVLTTTTVVAQLLPTPSPADLERDLRAYRFRNIGPYRGGRSLAVCGHPSQRNTYYAGATGGGVWKTEDGGDTWQSVSDTTFGSSSIGAITVAPSDPNVIWVGTGETDIRGNISPGDGLYRSTDAGVTWFRAGLTSCRMIADIAVAPDDADVALVSSMGRVFGPDTARGIYRTTNGGQSWTKVLYVNDSVGGLSVRIDPRNPRIVWASMWRAERSPWSLSSGGKGSSLWKSSDGGRTWKDMTQRPGLPTGILGKITVDPSRAQQNLVWAMVENTNGGLFRSDDGGNTWRRVNSSNDIRQRPWYFNHVFADPSNANVVYVLNVAFHRSDDGGRTFTTIGTRHGDHHDLWIDPNDNQRMIIADDGGFEVTVDGGHHWTEEDVPTAQFYHVTVDQHFPYRLYGAQQDNTTCSIPSRVIGGWSIDESDWYSVAGFESGWVVPHPLNPDVTFGGNYSGYLGRLDRRIQQERDISVYPNNPIGEGALIRGERFQWTFPILFSPHDPTVLYTTSQHVWKSTNEGESWTRISGDLTRNDSTKQVASGGPITKDNTGVEVYNTIFAFAESPITKGVLWAGSDCGLIHVSRDGGTTWTNVTPAGLPESQISIIEPSPYDAGTAYVAVTRYKFGDNRPYIYRTRDYGTTWTPITKGLNDGDICRVVRADPFRKGLLFAGHERGLAISFDDGATWSAFRQNLPVTPVHDLRIHPREKDLIVCTHGRSFWILDDISVLHRYEPLRADFKAYPPRTSYRVDGGSWSSPRMDVGENAPNGVVFHYSLADTTSKELRLTILSDRGDTISKFSSNIDTKGKPFEVDTKFYRDSLYRPSQLALTRFRGLNRFVWNMRKPDAETIDGMLLWGGGVRGPKVLPGTYTAIWTLGTIVDTVQFEIKLDPRLTVPMTNIVEQHNLAIEIHRYVDTVHKTINVIRQMRSAIETVRTRWKDRDTTETVEARTLSSKIIDTLTTVEEALVQTKAKAFQDLLNYPVKLNNKIASLLDVVESADERPTAQSRALFDELRREADRLLTIVDRTERDNVAKLNAAIYALQLPAIPPRTSAR